MNSEELYQMRHPNRLRIRQSSGETARARSTRKRTEPLRPAHSQETLEGPHRKWMQNFSLHAGPPLWLLLKQI